MSSQASGFIYCLKQMGFQAKYKTPKTYQGDGERIKRKADWDVGIAMDIVNMIDRFDMIILGTGDGDMLPVVQWAMQKGVDVIMFASGISKDLRDHATKCIEIPESLMETERPKGAKTHVQMVDQQIKEGKDPDAEAKVSIRKDIPSGEKVQPASRNEDARVVQSSVDKSGLESSDNVSSSDSPTPKDDSSSLAKQLGV